MNAAFSFLLAGVLVGPATAQPRPMPLNKQTFICNYTGDANPEVVYATITTPHNGHAERVVDRILKPIGLVRNFKIMECAGTENCFATVLNGQRYIIYDGAFMQRIEEETETDWSAISIMAHEIGHHLQGHTIDGRGGQPQKEIEADKFSGFVLHQLGASLNQSLVAVEALGDEHATATHPAKAARVEAIRKGWLEAEALYPKPKTASSPAVAAVSKPVAPAPTEPVVHSPIAEKAPVRPAAVMTTAAPARVGCVSGDCTDGRGTFIYPTRERYVGEFEEGDKHGEGTEYYADGRVKYRGNFRDNVRADYGVYYYKNGDKYVGWFQKNVPNGKGTYYFANGDRFVGVFAGGRPAGAGTLYDGRGRKVQEGLYRAD